MSNIVDAYPREGVQFRTKPVYQYDYGQIVKIHLNSLPAVYKVEFSNSTRADAVSTVQSTDEVIIPAQFLESGNPVYIWLVVVDAESRTTEYALIVPVAARAKPTDLEPSPEEQSEIDQTLAALNGAVEQVEQIAEAIPDTINDALEAAKESGEFDGEDGVSPEVTVALIQGGHRITITDANGTHTVDVLDGENGDAGRGIVSVQKTGTAGLVDTYTITYTDGTTSTFTVVNGQNGTTGSDGTTFTPTVSDEGVISWTNDGGKTNPQPVNIKGPQGDKGDTGATGATGPTGQTGPAGAPGISPSITVTDITGGHRVTITDADGQHSFDVMDGEDAVQDVQVNGTSVVTQGVANVPVAAIGSDGINGVLGVVKVRNGYDGLKVNPTGTDYGRLTLNPTSANQIKAGTDAYLAVTTARQHDAAFYGLAKAAGDTTQSASSNAVGTYTDDAKSAISTMLNGSVSVSGTTPSITALPGIQYVCGEVATLDITLPANGCVDVVFESGSTPTVLTVTPPSGQTVKWANGFDPTALEANTTYEINIKDGLGVGAAWT